MPFEDRARHGPILVGERKEQLLATQRLATTLCGGVCASEDVAERRDSINASQSAGTGSAWATSV